VVCYRAIDLAGNVSAVGNATVRLDTTAPLEYGAYAHVARNYSAVTAAGAAVGLFSDVQPTNIEGVSTATFSPGDSAPLGPVTIRVSAGGSVVGTTVVELVQP